MEDKLNMGPLMRQHPEDKYKEYYDKLTMDVLTEFLDELATSANVGRSKEDLKIIKLPKGMYRMGNMFFGKRGLKEFNKAMIEKTKKCVTIPEEGTYNEVSVNKPTDEKALLKSSRSEKLQPR